MKLKFSDEWPADIAMVLRAMESVGASAATPIHWPGDALFMAGVEIFEAIDKHFPGPTASGIIKNKTAGAITNEIKAGSASVDGRIRKPGREVYARAHTL